MKKLMAVLLTALLLLMFSACGPDYTSSDGTRDFHDDFFDYLVLESKILKFDDYYDSAWQEKVFIESWIKVTEIDGDPDMLESECYMHLRIHNGLVLNDRYFYWYVSNEPEPPYDEIVDAKEVPALIVTINTLLGFKYTDKIDKEWS